MKHITKALVLCLCPLLPLSVDAANITVGKTLSPLAVEELGECVLVDGRADFVPWSTQSLAGKVQVFQYVAARAGVDEIHRAFFDALHAQNYPADKVQQTTLVNAGDALWGTSGLVAGEIEKNKKQDPSVTLVVDSEGLGRKQWDLQQKTAALAVLDAAGTVLFFDEGEMTEAEAAAALEAVRNAVSSTPAAQ